LFWGLIPFKTVAIEVKKGEITRIQFPKHPMARWLKLYKIGQYAFFNFPQMSCLEWHPFTISSGPDEQTAEIHIRGLGNHTRELMERVKTQGAAAPPMWIRVDGPYGDHGLNYRRFPTVMLIAGGIGITPAVSLLKDVYRLGDLAASDKAGPPHCIESIYVVWVIPEERMFQWFAPEFDAALAAADKPGQPVLNVWCYVSRAATVERTDICVPGKPDFNEIFDTVQSQAPNKATQVFACGPELLVNSTWDVCMQRNRAGSRFDFHHETFEF
jgi:predicted ferric reductase